MTTVLQPTLERIEALFHQLVEVPRDQRQLVLDRLCGNDAVLMDELNSLLIASDSEQAVGLQRTAQAAAAAPDGQVRLFGPYAVDRLLGRGGMGAVYLAHRIDGQFEQHVAIKLIDLPLATELFRERFKLERQILAGLIHPFITRLLDGGVSDAGELYLVMEYVDGVSIARYCTEHRPTLRERLELFRKVCDAVQFAHQNLVVHRDLKPDNIFVVSDGTPRLLDFGTAKLIVPPTTLVADSLTQHGLQYFTPQYASPEQVLGAPITTATDTYSLGVLLFGLLTGNPPYEVREFSTAEMLRVICSEPAPRPSTVAVKPECAEFRIDADLDAIVLKALRKEAQQRYLTVDQFSADVQAWLEGRPVLARRGTWRYRGGKFMRRHKLPLAAAVLVATSVVAGVVGVVWQARVATVNRQRAEARSQDLRELSNSLLSEIDEAIKELPGSTPVQRMLVARVMDHLDRMSKDAADDRVTQIDLVNAYVRLGNLQGNPYEQNIGDGNGASQSLDKAIRIAESLRTHAPDDTKVLTALAFAEQARGEILFGLGRTEEAIDVTRRAVASFDARIDIAGAVAADFADAASAVGGLGDQLGQIGVASLGDQAGALLAYRKALALSERALQMQPDYVRSMRGVAVDHLKIGNTLRTANPASALDEYRRSLQQWQSLPAAEQAAASIRRGIAQTHIKMAAAFAATNQYPQAIGEFAAAEPTITYFAKADVDDSRASYELADFYSAEALIYAGMTDAAVMPNHASQRSAAEHAVALLRRSIAILQHLVSVNPMNDEWVANRSYQEAVAGSLVQAYALGGDGIQLADNGMARLIERVEAPGAGLDIVNLGVSARLTVLPLKLRDSHWTVVWAERAVASTRRKDPASLLSLARAYAANGDDQQAADTAREGLQLLPPVAQNAAAPRLFRELTLVTKPP